MGVDVSAVLEPQTENVQAVGIGFTFAHAIIAYMGTPKSVFIATLRFVDLENVLKLKKRVSC